MNVVVVSQTFLGHLILINELTSALYHSQSVLPLPILCQHVIGLVSVCHGDTYRDRHNKTLWLLSVDSLFTWSPLHLCLILSNRNGWTDDEIFKMWHSKSLNVSIQQRNFWVSAPERSLSIEFQIKFTSKCLVLLFASLSYRLSSGRCLCMNLIWRQSWFTCKTGEFSVSSNSNPSIFHRKCHR